MHENTHIKIRRIATATALSLGLGLGALGATPAAADGPVEFSDSFTFPDVNPCTDEDIQVTIDVDVREHRGHRNNFVVHVKRTGTTSDGYVMDHGVENFQVNNNVARGKFTDIWRNDHGSMWKVSHVFVAKRVGGLQVEQSTFECVKP